MPVANFSGTGNFLFLSSSFSHCALLGAPSNTATHWLYLRQPAVLLENWGPGLECSVSGDPRGWRSGPNLASGCCVTLGQSALVSHWWCSVLPASPGPDKLWGNIAQVKCIIIRMSVHSCIPYGPPSCAECWATCKGAKMSKDVGIIAEGIELGSQ